MIEGVQWVTLARFSQLAHHFSGMVLILPCRVACNEDVGDGAILLHAEWQVVWTVGEKPFISIYIGCNVAKLHLLGHFNFFGLNGSL